MYIDSDSCKNCQKCIPLCPVQAIKLNNKKVFVSYDECMECGVCKRSNICNSNAIKQPTNIKYPRILRSLYAVVGEEHPSTGMTGRGTDEMKTNDYTHDYDIGEVGFCIEFGRPGVGTVLVEFEKVTMKLVDMGISFTGVTNPFLDLMDDINKGTLKRELRQEKVYSVIIEFIAREKDCVKIFREVSEYINKEVDTVVTMSLISKADKSGTSNLFNLLKENNIKYYPNGKVNIGIGNKGE